jgi:hypothetical protein
MLFPTLERIGLRRPYDFILPVSGRLGPHYGANVTQMMHKSHSSRETRRRFGARRAVSAIGDFAAIVGLLRMPGALKKRLLLSGWGGASIRVLLDAAHWAGQGGGVRAGFDPWFLSSRSGGSPWPVQPWV